jgi:hypothetical protein
MASTSAQKQQVISKIRAVTKIVNDPSTNPLDSFIDNTVGSLMDDGFKTFDKQQPKKLTDLQSKTSKKKENKTDIFGDMIDIADAFLSGANKKTMYAEFPESKSRLKQITNESIEETIKSSKSIISNAVQQTLFVGDGICGTTKVFPSDTMSIKPSEFDFMNTLQLDPLSNAGQIMYEGINKGQTQLNTELYNLFSGGTLGVNTPSGENLMNLTWDSPTQTYSISGLTGDTGNTINQFIEGYYSTIEHIDISGVTKMATLMTLQGDGNEPISFDIGMNELNRLLSKMLKSCTAPQKTNLTSSNFNQNDEIEESYFDFNDVEGIDLDEESRRLEKVLKFKDCGNVIVPTDKSTFEDFVYLTRSTSKLNINQVVDSTLYNVSIMSYQNSQTSQVQNYHINLINNFILNMPKAMIGSLLSPKFLLPISIVYKSVVAAGTSALSSAKEIMKSLYKLFNRIIKDIFWKFLQEFWGRVKKDLLDFLKAFALKIIKDKAKKYALILAGLIALLQAILKTDFDDCNSMYNLITNTINTALSAASVNLPLSGLLASFSNLRGGTDPNSMLMGFVENAQKNGVNITDIHGEPNKMINMAKTTINSIMDNIASNSVIAGGNEEGFGLSASGEPVFIPRGSIKMNGLMV